MATATLPTKRAIGGNRPILIGVGVIIVAIIAALLLIRPQRATTQTTVATTTITRGSIIASVSGNGSVAAAQSLDLTFQSGGQVTDVRVADGDTVTKGQPLIQLDARELESQIASAKATLTSAQAKLNQTQEGNATPADIAASTASVANAEASLRSAQAQLTALRNPTADKISSAEYAVTQATISLQNTRNDQSSNKNTAKLSLDQSVAALTQAQSAYATANQNWQYVQDSGNDPTNPKTTVNGKVVDNKVSDTQRQQYYDTFVQAEAKLHSAEQAVEKSQLAYDNARQQEELNIQQAEAKLSDAKIQLTALRSPSKADMTQRQAAIDQAQANLDQAKANLAKLTASGTGMDLTIQQASITQAQESLRQLELKLEQTTLLAPFDGIVTTVNAIVGGNINAGTAAVSIINRDPLHVDLKLSENDVAKVQLNQPVAVTIDALPKWATKGTVSYIAPAATTSNDVVTYLVRVSFPDADPQVKVGMSTNLNITTNSKDGVLLVPNTALLPKGAGRVVQVPNADGTTREVEVQIGLTDGTKTEVVSGLNDGDRVVTTPGVSTQPKRPGLFGG
jgi:HlyD family secretion protein